MDYHIIKKTVGFSALLLILSSCNPFSEEEIDKKLDKKVRFAIVETSSMEEKSYLHYVSDLYNPTDIIELKYPYLGSNFNMNAYDQGTTAIASKHTPYKDPKTVLKINLTKKEVSPVKIDKSNIRTAAYFQNRYYITSNANWVSYLGIYEEDGTLVKEVSFDSENVTSIFIEDNQIFAFISGMSDAISSRLSIYDLDLQLKNEIDLSKVGRDHMDAVFDQNKLYFVNATSPEDNPLQQLGILDLDTHQLDLMELTEAYPNHIALASGKLLISNSSKVDPTGTKITSIDLSTMKETVHDLKIPILLMEGSKVEFYVLETNTCSVSIFDSQNLKLLGEVTANKKGGDSTYCSTIIK